MRETTVTANLPTETVEQLDDLAQLLETDRTGAVDASVQVLAALENAEEFVGEVGAHPSTDV